MVVYNVYYTMLGWYESMKRQPDESFRYDNCWRMKPLCIVFAKGKPGSVFYRILDECDGLIQMAADLEDKMGRIISDSDFKVNNQYSLSGYDITDVLNVAHELRRLINESEFEIANIK